MIETLFTISIVGLIVGFVFSMPIAGPISILITSHALRGQMRYCITAAIGASLIDMCVCFIVVHGFTSLVGKFAYYIPYFLLVGGVILFVIGVRIVLTKFDFEHVHLKKTGLQRVIKIKDKSGFWTGLLLNASNPSIFIGWLTSSFLVISLVASMGLNVAGLDQMLGKNVAAASTLTKNNNLKQEHIPAIVTTTVKETGISVLHCHAAPVADPVPMPKHFRLLFSTCYAFFVAVGTVLWFIPFSYILVRYHQKIKIGIITNLVHGLGIVLCCTAIYLVGRAIGMFIAA
jgi:threonine/homoserine/homoserine lactone efflux protein